MILRCFKNSIDYSRGTAGAVLGCLILVSLTIHQIWLRKIMILIEQLVLKVETCFHSTYYSFNICCFTQMKLTSVGVFCWLWQRKLKKFSDRQPVHHSAFWGSKVGKLVIAGSNREGLKVGVLMAGQASTPSLCVKCCNNRELCDIFFINHTIDFAMWGLGLGLWL